MEKVLIVGCLLACLAMLMTVLSVEMLRIFKRNRSLAMRIKPKEWVRCNTVDGVKWYERDKMKPVINNYGSWYSFSHKYYNDVL